MKENVLRGVALLDEKVPNWRDRVKKDRLQMWDCFYCVLGQLFGYYSTGLKALNITTDDGYNLGFHAKTKAKQGKLEKLWKEQL